MPPDNSDKTVFQQPAPGADRTVMKPMPGRRGGAAPTPGGNTQQGHRPAPGGQSRQGMVPPTVNIEATYFRTSNGLNPLVNAASALLAVLEKVRHAMNHDNVSALHQRLVNEMRAFETRAREQGARQEIILSARYVMCSALDEAILNTPWGSESAWGQRTLLTVFHNEASGGEKVFLILDRMRQSPAENLNMLELIYVCLCMGFEGKYRLQQRGRDSIEQMKDELFTVIRSYRGEYERTLASRWQGLGNVRKTLAEYLPTWVVATIAVTIIFFGYTGFRYWLYESATPVADQLHTITLDALPDVPSATDNQNK